MSNHSTEAFSEALHIREAITPKTGAKWGVTLLREGWSANKRYYTREALEQGYRLFEGALVHVDHYTDNERRDRSEGTLTRKAGRITEVRLTEGADGKLQIEGTMNIVLPWVRDALRNAAELGWDDWAGLSIDAFGRVQERMIESVGRSVPAVTGFVKASSADLVTVPAAGGTVNRLLASRQSGANQEGSTMAERIGNEQDTDIEVRLQEVAAAAAEAAVARLLEQSDDEIDDDDELTEEELALLDELIAEEEGEYDDDDDYDYDDEDYDDEDYDGEDPVDDLTDELQEAVSELQALREAAQEQSRYLSEQVEERRIQEAMSSIGDVPDPLAGLARDHLALASAAGNLDSFTIEQVVEATREAAAQLQPANPWGTSGAFSGSTTGRSEKYMSAMTGAFRNGAEVDGVEGFESLKEAYTSWTGKNPLKLHPMEIFKALAGGIGYDAGFKHDEKTGRLKEALTTASWGDIFADVMHNEMMSHFGAHPEYSQWRKVISRVAPIKDFQTHNVTRWGGYANLPSVAEGGDYTALTSPTDERVGFSVGKYGGTETITWEMVVNDDMGAIGQIPARLGYAAARGVNEFYMDLVTSGNPTLWDSNSLWDNANHANDATNPLTVTGFDATERAMMDQVPYNHPSNETLGPRGKVKYVIVSREYRLRARMLFNPSERMKAAIATTGTFADSDLGAFASSGIETIEYGQLSGDIWYAMADPKMPGMNTLIAGFLGGRQAPELWVADNPTTGAMFSNDKILYKIRYVYGGVIAEYRGLSRQNPA